MSHPNCQYRRESVELGPPLAAVDLNVIGPRAFIAQKDSGPIELEMASSNRALVFNLYCIAGALIGIAAIFTPWITTSAGLFEDSNNQDEMIRDGVTHSHYLDYLLGGFLFVVGCLIAFYTPLGGSIQSVGLVLFLHAELDRQEAFRDSTQSIYHGSVGFGFFLGCVSAVIVLSSIRYSYLMRQQSREISWSDKTRVLLRTRTFHVRADTTLQDHSSGQVRLVNQYKRPLAAICLMFVIAILIVAGVNYPYGPDPPLQKVDGGVLWVRDWVYTSLAWTFNLTVYDSSQSTTWLITSEDLGNETWVVHSWAPLGLGDMNVTLSIIDFQGNMRMDLGDAVVLTADYGGFHENQTYRIALTWGHGSFSVPRQTVEASFTIHGGELDSWISIEPPSEPLIYL